jgi:hypothetical protein
MLKRRLSVMIGFIPLLGGSLFVSAQERTSSHGKEQDQQPIKYEAEDGIPSDKAGEKRRDYAVLEATLNDLTSPKNPEYKYHIQNVGQGREIVIDDMTCEIDLFIDLGSESHNIDYEDARSIPKDIQNDFKRRNDGPPRSLADFKPANPNIIVRDLDKIPGPADDFLEGFFKAYPKAWGYVWAYLPAYSKDGRTATVVFEGGPNGDHGLSWVFMLTKKGKRWEVQWRHCCPRE